MARLTLAVLAAGFVGALTSPAAAKTTVYKPAPGEEPSVTLFRKAPSDCPGGYWARQRQFDRWGNVKGMSRPRYICP